MLTSLVQEDNWTNPVTVQDLSTSNKHDLVCERHKNMHYNCGVLLVHLIDGFTIEESNIPFRQDNEDVEENNDSGNPVDPNKENKPENLAENAVVNASLNSYPEDKDELMSLLPTKCKYCGGPLPEERAMWGKRFCSVSCGKKYSVTCSQKFRKALHRRSSQPNPPRSSQADNLLRSPVKRRGRGRGRGRHRHRSLSVSSSRQSVGESSSSYTENCHSADSFDNSYLHFTFPPRYPLGYGLDLHDIEDELYDGVDATENFSFIPLVRWSVDEVFEFIRTIPGCENCAQKFYSEEIDGQALLLLKIEHMIHTMKLKLGPALKIASHLRTVKLEYGIHTRSKYLSSPFS